MQHEDSPLFQPIVNDGFVLTDTNKLYGKV